MRSPLHGVLAAAEFLSGTNLDEFQGSLLETINACSRTLLDTMNQVLDFSKIVSLERKTRQMKQRKQHSLPDSDNQASTSLDTSVSTDLALLAEEVVEGVCLGHAYSQKSSSNPLNSGPEVSKAGRANNTGSESPVEVILDVSENNWTYYTQPGALRRIVMNVFGNAMKYTDAGRVCLRLEATEASDGHHSQPTEDLVTLTVSDTGKGISEEFLQARVYTPFAQEDTLAVGTGLGLSIVRSLVKSMNGSIDIQSRPGEGTVVKIVLRLSRPGNDVEVIAPTTTDSMIESAPEPEPANDCHLLRHTHTNKRAAILGIEPASVASHPMWSIVSTYLCAWFGLELVSWPSDLAVDVILADDYSLANNCLPRLASTSLPPLVIICSRAIDYKIAQSQWSSLADIVSIITRPCGPYKLARTIQKCFDSPKTTVPTIGQINSSDIPLRSKTTLSPNTDAIPEEKQKSFEDLSDAPDLINDSTSSLTPASTTSTPSQGSSEVDPMSTLNPPCLPKPSPVVETPVKMERTPRVLVVDDNSINLNLMLTFMKKRKLEVLDSADNGQVAVDAVERLPQGYDLIFMGRNTPDLPA